MEKTSTSWTLVAEVGVTNEAFGKGGSFTSTALVAPATAQTIRARWGNYVLLHCSRSQTHAAFRIELRADIPVGVVQIDHWPTAARAGATFAPQTGDTVDAQCIAAPLVRVATYAELVPAAPDQPSLALAFLKRLLRTRVFVGADSTTTLQYDGIDYGHWRVRLYFPGSATTSTDTATIVGVVDEQTLMLQFPFAVSRPPVTGDTQTRQPIGAHGESFCALVAMALEPITRSAAHKSSAPQRTAAVAHSRSILLHGASGAGKTTLVECVATHLHASILTIDCSLLLAAPQVALNDVVTAALRVQPSIVLIEDLELLFPRSTALDATKHRLVGRLVKCLDVIHNLATARIVIVATVTAINALHLRVRQLFADEVALESPTTQWTIALLASLLPPHVSIPSPLLQSIAVRYGQRPSTIVSIARQLAMRHPLSSSDGSKRELLQPSEVDAIARSVASTTNSNSALAPSVPAVAWSDIGGLDAVKQQLLEMVVWPLERPQVFRRMGITPPLGLLLHGPPGTGKTLLAKAAAAASRCHFVSLAASDLLSGEFGESERAVTQAFAAARAQSPCLVFIDEFQSLFGDRTTAGATTSRMISQLLIEMDSLRAVADDASAYGDSDASDDLATEGETARAVASRVFVLAATNALGAIDAAFLQPGRFENVVYVGLPNSSERHAILALQRTKMPWHDDVDVSVLVNATDGANAATLVALCQTAAMQAMQRVPADAAAVDQYINMDDFVAALASGTFGFDARKSNDDVDGTANDE